MKTKNNNNNNNKNTILNNNYKVNKVATLAVFIE